MLKRFSKLADLTGCYIPCSSKKCTDDMRAKVKNATNAKKHNVSKLECAFKHFLEKNGFKDGSGFKQQEPVPNCPFMQGGRKHKADFYLPDIDLYVEVKGEMTFYQVNLLHWLLKYSGKKFYILQMTCEDWMGDFEVLKKDALLKGEKLTVSGRIEDVTSRQFDELSSYLHEGLKDDINMIMTRRLADYLRVRRKDIARWLEAQKARS